VHGRFEATITRPYNVVYASRRDFRNYAMSHEDVMREFGHLIVYQGRMEKVIATAMGDTGYIMRATELEPLIDAAMRIQATVA
jgi:hypothetical protein